MTDIVKNELERNVKELERCVELIVPYTNTTEEIIRLNFESIRMLVDYCKKSSKTEIYKSCECVEFGAGCV